MTDLNVIIGSLHYVLFVHDSNVTLDNVNIAAQVNSLNIFGNENTVLPLSDDIPAEIPRIILGGEEYQCLIGNERITFVKEPKVGHYQNILPEYIDYCKQLVNMLVDIGFVISRMGIVVEGEIKTNSFDFVQKNYLNNQLLNSDGFELGFLFHPIIKGLRLNKWVRVKSIHNVLVFLIDYNTSVEVDFRFTVQQLNDIMDELLEIFLGDQESLFQFGVVR